MKKGIFRLIFLGILVFIAFMFIKLHYKEDVFVVKNAEIIGNPRILAIENAEKTQKIAENEQKMAETIEKPEENDIKLENSAENGINYRLTSYYPEESSNCTGSGKCTQHFTTNDKGWYLYDGKLVLAAATTYLQKSYGTKDGRHYFKYYDEVDVKIDGITYRGIILDSCGACMSVSYEERLDLFVNSANSVIDRGYKGNNLINVKW